MSHVSIGDILQTLNAPDLHEGLSDGRYTNKRLFPPPPLSFAYRISVCYYITLPLQGKRDKAMVQAFAIIDSISYSEDENILGFC